MIAIELGCKGRKEGRITVDRADADVNVDLEEASLPFDDNSVDDINACAVLEHIVNLIPLMEELHRILKPGGVLTAMVPMWNHPGAWQDPTHVRAFTPLTFKYFTMDLAGYRYMSKYWHLLNQDINEESINVTMTPIKEEK